MSHGKFSLSPSIYLFNIFTHDSLSDIATEVSWTEKNYPDLCMPISPCITLQWCFRDGKLVNLPWSLLVPGDVILLQPSQKIVAECCLLEVSCLSCKTYMHRHIHLSKTVLVPYLYIGSFHQICNRPDLFTCLFPNGWHTSTTLA